MKLKKTGGLAEQVDESTLAGAFNPFGEINALLIPRDSAKGILTLLLLSYYIIHSSNTTVRWVIRCQRSSWLRICGILRT
jgi:hypothetical protein